jgi:hypothetical protein
MPKIMAIFERMLRKFMSDCMLLDAIPKVV